MTDKTPRDADGRDTPRRLYAEFDIDIAESGSCPLDEFGDDIEEIRQRATAGTCHTDTTLADDDCEASCGDGCTEVVHTVRDVDAACICPVFERFGCIPNMTAVTDSRVRVETYLPDRGQLSDLVDDLKSVSNGVYLRRLKSIEPAGDVARRARRRTRHLEVRVFTAAARRRGEADGVHVRPKRRHDAVNTMR